MANEEPRADVAEVLRRLDRRAAAPFDYGGEIARDCVDAAAAIRELQADNDRWWKINQDQLALQEKLEVQVRELQATRDRLQEQVDERGRQINGWVKRTALAETMNDERFKKWLDGTTPCDPGYIKQPQEPRGDVADVLRRLDALLRAWRNRTNLPQEELGRALEDAAAAIRELQAERDAAIASRDVAERGYKEAVSHAQWQASTNAELNRVTAERDTALSELRAAHELIRLVAVSGHVTPDLKGRCMAFGNAARARAGVKP